MREQPRRSYTCLVCDGPAHRRTSITVKLGNEDADQPLLHLRQEDWADHPHDVVTVDTEYREQDVHGKTVYVCTRCDRPVGKNSRTAHTLAHVKAAP